jgi:hypothetical protein
MRTHWTVGLAAAALWACTGTQAPVPVSGSEADLAQLAGEWVGEYSSVETGRSGSIVFHLIAGTDSAHGDVLMSAGAMQAQPRMPETGQVPGAQVPAPQTLAISFVRIAGGRVSGRLAPYTDPDCQCPMRTVFEGRLNGTVLEGTYTSRRDDTAAEFRGRWRVTRRTP